MAAPILKKSIICAIDFGTSRSGYGYMLMSEEDKILTEQVWEDAPDSEKYCKTLTQILYEDTKPIAWGFRAPVRMAEIAEDAEDNGVALPPQKYSLLRYFKMGLRDYPNGTFVADSGRSFNVIDVIADYLKLLWKWLDDRITKFTQRKLNISEVKWCLTIPAIWTNAEKASMRRAAFKAGLIETEDVSEDQFMLVLEPEAAAAWCLHERKKLNMPLLEGESFLVVDAGGGTVDLTAHEYVGGTLREVTVGSGGPCGSSKINLAFWDYLKRICNNNLETLQKESPKAELTLMTDFENQKQKTADYSAVRNVKVPDEVAAFLDSLPAKPDAYVQKPQKLLRLAGPALQTIFAPTIAAIEDLTRKQVDEYFAAKGKRFDYIFLVGGFGASQLLLKHLEAAFVNGPNPATNVRKVIQPTSPGMAVICGAVLLTKDPSLIRIRKMRDTYGIGATVQFVPGTHDEQRKRTIPNRPGFWIDNVLDKFVCKGDEVEVNSVVKRTYKPQVADQRSMSIALYFSPLSRGLVYVDNVNQANKLGEIIVDMPDTSGGLNRSVEVQLYFGRSELQVSAIEGVSQKKYNAVLQYDTKLLEYSGPKALAPTGPTVNNHIIFINDVSGSMATADALPSLPWMTHKNRVGALYESCHTFLQARAGTQDIVSCILYCGHAWTLFTYKPVDPDTLAKTMMTQKASGGTSFVAGIKQLESVLSTSPNGYRQIAFFMTDGGCSDNGATTTLQSIMNTHGASGFTLHTVQISTPATPIIPLLQQLAQIGRGSAHRSAINLADMKKTYAALAALLE